jgi:hypothetical protein
VGVKVGGSGVEVGVCVGVDVDVRSVVGDGGIGVEVDITSIGVGVTEEQLAKKRIAMIKNFRTVFIQRTTFL